MSTDSSYDWICVGSGAAGLASAAAAADRGLRALVLEKQHGHRRRHGLVVRQPVGRL